MAESRQALRTRIKSVQSTRKITKAMEMIANAKLFRQRTRMEANREYAQRLQDTVNEIVSHNQNVESQYFVKNTQKSQFTIVFCSDLGLCGAYNANVIKYAKENLNINDPLYLVGTSLYRQFKEAGFNLVNDAPVSTDRATYNDLKKIAEDGTKRYQRNEIGRVSILYTRFVNTMSFQPSMDCLLPCEVETKQPQQNMQETLFEPDPQTILDELIPMMIADVVYADWMESATAEQGSRRVAMKTASDNADDLNETLQLEYNKARQAAITQEITEIVGGSNAV